MIEMKKLKIAIVGYGQFGRFVVKTNPRFVWPPKGAARQSN